MGAATTGPGGSILGPYVPMEGPIACPLNQGGAIDPMGFLDQSQNLDDGDGGGGNQDGGNGNGDGDEDEDGEGPGGRRYLLYKVDGNAKGGGGDCGNGVDPIRATPIMLQEVDRRDGVTVVGDAVEVLDRRGDMDGPLVEAPDLMVTEDGRYVLFYSNHCWNGPGYSVNYAVARDIRGPYQRAGDGALIRSGDGMNITAPGGAASVSGGGWLLFHGDCPAGRCLFGAEMEVDGSRVVVW